MTRARRVPLVALSPILFSAAAGCRKAREAMTFPGAPVVLISIDPLRADHLPAYGYRAVETPVDEIQPRRRQLNEPLERTH